MVFFNTLLLSTLLIVGTTVAQDIVVKGKITDVTTGEALPGCTVLLKGTNNGTSTSPTGEFSIQASGDAVLLISFIGYKTQEVTVNNRTVIDITMESDAQSLQEVVVVGYGSVEQKDVTGVVSKVTSKDFNRGLITAPDKLLDGKVAGLQITSNGEPGGSSEIRLRGVSINGQTPLFVVDGVPLDDGGGGVVGGRNPLNFINPNDVADITVLKDASASAIYGARGANGVIIITTKSGTAGKPKINYDSYYSASFLTRRPDVLNTSEFRNAFIAKQPQAVDDLGTADTDWMKEVTQLATSMQQNISVNGGVKKTTYYGSINYQDTKGVLRETQNKKLNFGLKVSQELFNDDLKLTLNTKTGNTWEVLGANVLGTASSFDPTQYIYNDNDPSKGYFQWGNALAAGNPVATQAYIDNDGKSFRIFANLEAEYKIPFVKGLSFVANVAYDKTKGEYNGLTMPDNKGSNGGTILEQEQTKTNELYEYYAKYKKQFGKHAVDASAGYAYQNFKSEMTEFNGDSIDNSSGEWVAQYDLDTIKTSVENRLISFFGRLNYDYSGKYLLTVSLRRDGSSRFGETNRWGLFPSVAVGWRVLNEDFAAGLRDVFSELKLRVGWGVTGNQAIRDYAYSTYYRYSIDGASYQMGTNPDGSGIYVPTLRPTAVDPNIKWEETISTNIGIDASFMEGRLSASLNYYNKVVKDLLFEIAVPAGANLSDRVLTNIGEVTNNGFEVILNAVAIKKSNLTWNLGYNFAFNKNEITKLDNLQGEDLQDFPGYPSGGISGDVGQTIQVRKVGQPVDVFYTYQHKYENGLPVRDRLGVPMTNMYVDQNGDNIINEKDLVTGKASQPKVIMGLTSNLAWKQWDMALTIKSSLGQYVYNNVASSMGYTDRLVEMESFNNVHSSAFDTEFKTKQLKSDYYVQEAWFIKFDNISIGYNFKPMKFGKIRAYTTVQNPFMITPYKGVDPEIFNGIDNNLYPRSLTTMLGLSVNFN